MLLLASLSPQVIAAIRGHVAAQGISISDFVEVAVLNQLLAEREGVASWPDLAPPPTGREDLASVRSGDVSAVRQEDPLPASQQQASVHQSPSKDSRAVVDLVGVRRTLAFRPLAGAAAAPSSNTMETWDWSQWNRYFPFKLCVRAVLAVGATGEWPRLDRAAEECGRAATALYGELERRDRAKGRGRDERLATALPKSESTSQRRFTSQYLGTFSGARVKPGATVLYQLISIREGHACLTEAGIAFARLPNPLLDQRGEPGELLSAEEVQFIIEQIGSSVPAERAAFSTILELTAERPASLSDVIGVLATHLPTSWSDTMRRNQAAAALSRMADLQLITKERRGREVANLASVRGEEALVRWGRP